MTPKESVRKETGLWKDSYDIAAVQKLGGAFKRIRGSFDVDGFVKAARDGGLLSLELKARINLTARILKDFLPNDYSAATKMLIGVAPELGQFLNWTLTSYVEQLGLDRFDESLEVLQELTKYGTGEFAIRPFVIADTERVMQSMHVWADSENEHVRRLAAEGSRPLGVWVAHIEKFKKDPKPVLALLEKLRADSSLYVRKAVANNLNDIAKHHPDLVIKTCARWKRDRCKETDWIIRHGCRGLIKSGRPEVFPLLGFTADPEIVVSPLRLNPRMLKIGESLQFSCKINSKARKTQRLAIDFTIHYVKANGKTSAKIFKLCEKSLKPGETLRLAKSHSFLDRSTRRHFAGQHRIELVVNGNVHRVGKFELH